MGRAGRHTSRYVARSVWAASAVVPAGSVPTELAESERYPFTPLAPQAIVTHEPWFDIQLLACGVFVLWGHPLDVVVDHRDLAYRVVGGFFKQARPNIWERNHKCVWSAVTPLGPSIAGCNPVPERRDTMSEMHMCDAPYPTDISQALMHT